MVIQAPMQQLVQCLSVLPGVGEKTATRLALYLVNCPAEQALALSDAIAQARERIRLCSLCYNYTEKELCPICASTVRERRVVCVVETPGDIISFERIGGYDGCYHVLHGAIAPLDGVGPDQLRVRELLARVESGGIDEVILATNPTMNGNATAVYIAGQLNGSGVQVTRIAQGIQPGADIGYADQTTLKNALEWRRSMK
jgi:recombination protein RecR